MKKGGEYSEGSLYPYYNKVNEDGDSSQNRIRKNISYTSDAYNSPLVA